MKSVNNNIDFQFDNISNANKVNTPLTGSSLLVMTGFMTTYNADTSGGIFTSTLPSAVGIEGSIFNLRKLSSDSNIWTIQCDGIETINGSNSIPIQIQYNSVAIQSDGTNWVVI